MIQSLIAAYARPNVAVFWPVLIWLGLAFSPARAQELNSDSSSRLTSSLSVGAGYVQLKEELLRGLVHTGFNAQVRFASCVVSPDRIWDWSIAVSPGVLSWHGSTDLSFDVAPMDAGYAVAYTTPSPRLHFFLGGYARLQTTYTQYIHLDGLHPYWATLDHVGVRHWLRWELANGDGLSVQSDLALLAVASRPPEWRDYATTTLNAWRIVQRVYESPRIVTLFDCFRFMTRTDYTMNSDIGPRFLCYYQFEYDRVDFPAVYTNIQSMIGIGIPL